MGFRNFPVSIALLTSFALAGCAGIIPIAKIAIPVAGGLFTIAKDGFDLDVSITKMLGIAKVVPAPPAVAEPPPKLACGLPASGC